MYKIAYITSSRADYGIVRNYLNLLNNNKNINLEILVTGSLLDEKYGAGYHIIENDGFKIVEKIKLDMNSTDSNTIIKNMSTTLYKFGEFFEKHNYDLIIILGDRYEMLEVAIAAAMNRMKILHIHGGEITLGNYDEFIRHCISKMSLYHFTSTEEYKNRVIQLGENPNRVFYIGAMGSENCKSINLSNVDEQIIQLKQNKYFVVLFHPETLTENEPIEQINVLLSVIKKYISTHKFIFLGTNSDTNSNQIRMAVNKFVNENKNAIYFENLHPDAYHYLLKNSIALIGNSSSGIIEAPTLGCYTINIGDRQKGRVKGNSIIDVDCKVKEIENAIDKVLQLPKKEELENPYYKEKASNTAYEITLKLLKKKTNLIKEFYDIK